MKTFNQFVISEVASPKRRHPSLPPIDKDAVCARLEENMRWWQRQQSASLEHRRQDQRHQQGARNRDTDRYDERIHKNIQMVRACLDRCKTITSDEELIAYLRTAPKRLRDTFPVEWGIDNSRVVAVYGRAPKAPK